MNAVRAARSVFQTLLLMAVCIAPVIPAAARGKAVSERAANATKEASPLKKAGPPRDPYTTFIVTGERKGTEFAAASEIAALIAAHQVTGPRGEAALRVVPLAGGGGLQSITDVLTVTDVDMSIVPVALLNRARSALPGDIRKQIAYIAPLYVEEFYLLARGPAANISDLAGQTVNLGRKNSAAALLGAEIFERLGIKVNAVHLDHSAALSALRAGAIAADLELSSKPVNALASYNGTEDGFHFVAIPFSPALREDFLPAQLTGDDYPAPIRQKSISTVAVRSVLVAYNWPKKSGRYRLLDFFVRSLFSQFSELKAGPHNPDWREVNLAANLPGWSRFLPAQRWFDRLELESFLDKWGDGAEADRARLLHDFLRWREHSGGG